ncbi:MAG: prolipoprotein diacylglyceryl transferase [Bacilli bacterium]
MNPLIFSFGKFGITWYSVLILLGVLIATIIISKEALKFKLSNYFITNIIFWCVIFGILGARIYYVLFNLDYYLSYPLEIIKIWNGGLAIHGGIIAGLITLIVYCKKYKISAIRMTDIAVPGLIIAQAIGRWGNFFNQEAYGSIVSKSFLNGLHLPSFIVEAMKIGGFYHHPTFLYESILCLIGFFVIIGYRSSKNANVGSATSLYLVWYGVVRFFIESLRTDSLMLMNLKVAQIVSILMIIAGVALFIYSSKKNPKYNISEDKVDEILF